MGAVEVLLLSFDSSSARPVVDRRRYSDTK